MDGVDMRHKAYETRNLQLAPTGDGEDQETKYTQVSKKTLSKNFKAKQWKINVLLSKI